MTENDEKRPEGGAPASGSGQRAIDGKLDRGQLRSSMPPSTLAGFLAAVVALLIISLLSYDALRSRADGARGMSRTLEITRQLESLLSVLKDAETGQRGYLLTGNERYLEPYEGAVAALPRDIASLRAALGDDAEQIARLDAIEREATMKFEELEQTIALHRAADVAGALAIVREDRGRRIMVRIFGLIDEMKAVERSALVAKTAAWEEAVTLSSIITWLGAAVLLALIAAAAVLSSRDFRAQQVEAWVRTGQTELGSRIRGEQSLETLGDNIIGFVAGYLEAQVGAIYFAEHAGQLRRVGGYALARAPERDTEGEAAGLTRRALEQGTPILVRNVPHDFFTVSAALGRSQPRQLLLAPGAVDGVTNSVMELGFFHPVSPELLELVRRLAEPIGAALRTAQLRRELLGLLEETTRQAEELQTQQEELRVGNEELEQQSRVLQSSQQRLENQQVELEQINSQLEEQMQELEIQRDDLGRARADLQRANDYKSEFLANMSHELRTPLNSSLILAKLLADNRTGNLDEEQIKFAQTIYGAGNDLLELINDILDLSKIEAGKLDVRAETVALAPLLDGLRNTFDPVARDKQLAFGTAITPGLPTSIVSDATRVQQILNNLISNALKFTAEGGVSLTVRRHAAGRIAFDVVDTGIGIAPAQHELVFEAFRQADGTVSRKYGGTGLGLSISRDLARRLGGELTVASAPGRGSTFTLVLPELIPDDAAAPAQVAAAPEPPRPRRPSRLPTVAQASAGDELDPRTILVIEDDAAFAGILRELAAELDFPTVWAQTAEQGLALARRQRPSAIVLDVGLPDRSGLSVLDALKHDPATRHIPVHIISGVDYSQAALEMGAAGYAIKPVGRDQLAEALRKLEAKFTQKLRRVLVVEDDDVQRDATCRLLAGADVETVAVPTAAAALERLHDTTFDCMVLDLTLPDRRGIELLEEMSLNDQHAFPPVIVYTGRVLAADEEQQLRRFSQSIIIKGARSPERLLDEVTLFLHQVEAELPPERQRMLRDVRHREAVFEGRRVLVVEDDVRNIFALSSVLEPKGAKVEIARNGREALEHLERHPGIDLVLMDIMMPEMDGLEATRRIRQQSRFARLPIIALTAKAMVDDRENCIAAGANDYIAKPLDVDKLLSLARVWMPK
jgi:CheY-like chemotaxis protein/CHASE3 domain sensor protein